MSAPRAVAVVGFKDTGKTQAIEMLVRELTRRGLRVGTLKHASRNHPLDTPGKDTWRHMEAGSVASAILTSERAGVFLNHPVGAVEAAEKVGPLDIVILEGFKSLDTVARIMIPGDAEEVEALANGLEIAISGPSVEGLPIKERGVPVIHIGRVGELADLVEAKAFPLLPGLDCDGCGYGSCKELAQAILAGEADAEKCVNYASGALRLRVNGIAVSVNPFVQRVMRDVVLSMVRALRGGEEPRRVELAFDVGDEESG